MKKLFYSMFALAALAMTNTSCSDELMNEAGTNSNEATVSFNVKLENEVGSRAVGDGTTAKELHYYVYKADNQTTGRTIGDEIAALRGTTTVKDDLTAEVKFTLVKGQTYNFMFWAQCVDGSKYYTIDPEEGTVKVLYTDADADENKVDYQIAANDEARDAFFKVRKDLTVNGPIDETITLKRPFAQVNVGTGIGSLDNAATAEVYIKQSKFVIDNVATKLDTYTGAVSEPVKVTYTAANIIEDMTDLKDGEGDLKDVDDTDYEYLAMNYILVHDTNTDGTNPADGSKQAIINATLEILGTQSTAQTATLETINTFEIPNIPVQRNWRTNIIGDLLNETVTFNIVIDPNFDNDHNYDIAKELAYIFASGGEVTLEDNVTVDAPFYRKGATGDDRVIKDATIVLNLNGKTLTYTGDDLMSRLGENATLIINGPGEIITSDYIASANEGATVYVNGDANTTFSGETTTLFQANGGKVYISGGTFKNTDATNKATYLINHIDAQKNNGLIEISGGTFHGFNPAASTSENPAMNFLKYGYTTTVTSEGETNIYTVVEDELEQASMNGGTIKLTEGVELVRGLTVTKDLILDLNGQTLTSSQVVYIPEVISALICAKDGATVTIKGNGTIDGHSTEDYAIETRGGKLIIENGTFIGNTTAAYAVSGEIIIKGGTFSQKDYENNNYVLNLKSNGELGGKITVTGGTFVGFDPANNAAENPKMSFLADGYAATAAGDDFVVGVKAAAAGETVTLSTDADFTNSIKVNGGTLDGDGYTLTQVGTPVTNLLVHATGAATIKNLNIVGADTAWDDNGTERSPRALYFTDLNGDIVIENVTTSGVCYALNVNASTATKPSDLIVNNSTLAGWTSYGSGLTSATFNNVKFAFGSYFTADADKQSNGYCRPYVDTRFNGCAFEKGFKIDASHQSNSTTYTPAISLKNCTLDGVAITESNVAELFEDEITTINVTIIK